MFHRLTLTAFTVILLAVASFGQVGSSAAAPHPPTLADDCLIGIEADLVDRCPGVLSVPRTISYALLTSNRRSKVLGLAELAAVAMAWAAAACIYLSFLGGIISDYWYELGEVDGPSL